MNKSVKKVNLILNTFPIFYDMFPLMEMMKAPDKSEFFYHHRTEDGWVKKIF
ncbi:hypothetical protein HMPREF9957_1046 [Streptococcus mitis SK1080]|uniref:Uncharacterized protein n=1 Tax=Streptococcus mitis SK1080 TaxID=1008453 RepID=F9HM79_STRMT|nr:hypothetical protein [Streptococcus mitis]EGP68818.1 hypothetical protein HMPREF9957_1046 [Streptococcus mitis SK1080]